LRCAETTAFCTSRFDVQVFVVYATLTIGWVPEGDVEKAADGPAVYPAVGAAGFVRGIARDRGGHGPVEEVDAVLCDFPRGAGVFVAYVAGERPSR
jgi:hypothetical protein